MKELGKLSAEERPKAGQVINQAKQSVQQAILDKKTALQSSFLEQQLRVFMLRLRGEMMVIIHGFLMNILGILMELENILNGDVDYTQVKTN